MLRKSVLVLSLILISAGLVFVAGCETKAQSGAGVGGLAGAGLGAIIGNQSGHAGEVIPSGRDFHDEEQVEGDSHQCPLSNNATSFSHICKGTQVTVPLRPKRDTISIYR